MTVQGSETLIYNDKEYRTHSKPLEEYLENEGIKFEPPTTGCWRGYFGSWSIENDKLYLTDLKAWILLSSHPYKTKEVELEYLFPKKDKVFANWFSGEIRLPHGNKMQIPILYNIPEQYLVLKFVSGELIGSYIQDNTHLYSKYEPYNLPF